MTGNFLVSNLTPDILTEVYRYSQSLKFDSVVIVSFQILSQSVLSFCTIHPENESMKISFPGNRTVNTAVAVLLSTTGSS
jgi:hypothetical protein